ncbi:hypothetical protein ACJMK2_022693 [Sinanodonta woodiana]|uniref:Sushi, nidogen and EGF-like domain-containing protein 1 n=1 Tax=Sinanodonta woodiana TaxID=1069815 RepID=A0ABD3TLZ2_SINWO
MTAIQMILCLGMLAILPVNRGQAIFHSCEDIYKHNIKSQSGVYSIYNRINQPYQVYCEFHQAYGYTFVAANTSVAVNIDDLHTSSDHVWVRFLRNNHAQTQTKVEQISIFKSRYQLSLQYSKNDGYATPLNANLGPYLYLGFLPASEASHNGATQGYRANGVDYTFSNCDGNQNSYLAFVFNPNNRPHNEYHKTCCNTPLIHQIVDTSTPATFNIPEYFYSYFEMHMGGCGGYGVPEEFVNVRGAALGMRFNVTCRDPAPVSNATHTGGGTAFGSIIRYTCSSGTLLSGNLERRCVETGEYTGLPPVCGPLDPCASNPCANGGTCYGLENTFVCECSGNFQGVRCEISR